LIFATSGRDVGLPDYNTLRRHHGLPRVSEWREINPVLQEAHPEIFSQLKELYEGDIDNIDVYVGGMLETTADGNPGPLFTTIIKEQFERLRESDRFWFENRETS